jgi:hypothetical protein
MSSGSGRRLAPRERFPKVQPSNDAIQPFPTFSEINIAALKALRVEIAAMPNLVAAWP